MEEMFSSDITHRHVRTHTHLLVISQTDGGEEKLVEDDER